MSLDGPVKYLNQCFNCLAVLQPRKGETQEKYLLRRYCGLDCIEEYVGKKRAKAEGKR